MFDDFVRFQAQIRGDSPAILTPRRMVSFREYETHVRRAVYELGDLRVEPGQSVSVAVESPYLDWILLVALARLGIASAPPEDVESLYRITDKPEMSGRNVFFLSREVVDRIRSGPERESFRRVPDANSLARVFRTSGTTGAPKRIALSWRAIMVRIGHIASLYGKHQGMWWITTGSHTVYGYTFGFAAAACGYPAAMGLGPDGELIAEVEPRLLGIVPVQLETLLATIPVGHPKWPLHITTGGSAFPIGVIEQVKERLTFDILAALGSTEASRTAAADLDLMEREPLTTGYIVPGTSIRLIDDNGDDVPTGEVGRLCITNEALATGYLGSSDDTLSEFRDGWFYSSDLARLREDGLLFLEGRADELMNLGGHKILPAAIDAVVATCPGVKEAAAFAFRGTKGVDQCGIAVVALDGFDEAAVKSAAASKMMRSQRTEVMLVDSLPRNAMGKVERLKLRAMMEEIMGTKTEMPGATAVSVSAFQDPALRPT